MTAPAAANAEAARNAAASFEGLGAASIADAMGLAGIAAWRLDLATGHVNCSEQLFRLLGMPPRQAGMHRSEAHALVHPQDRERLATLNAELFKQRGPLETQLRYVLADGRTLHLLSRRTLLRDAAGQPTAVLGVTLDVTERVLEQQRTLEATRRIELMSRAAGIGWWTVEGSQITWNDELRRMVGWPAGEPLPAPLDWAKLFIHEGDRERVCRQLAAWLGRGGDLYFTFRLLDAAGELRDMVSHARAEGDGEHVLRFGLLIDVTERRFAARALRDARERAALAAEGVGIGTWEWVPSLQFTRWDANMWRLRGRTPHEEAPDVEALYAMVHAEDRERLRKATVRAMEAREPLAQEFRVIWPDGQVRWLASRSLDLPDPEGGIVRRIGVNWDVTDRRRAEQARHDAEVALRESQAKSRFLARMSHELRTPLNAVLGFAQLMQAEETAPALHDPRDATGAREGATGRSTEHASAGRSQRLQHIVAAGRHLLSLINDTLDLARVEGGELALQSEVVSLHELVQQTLPLVAPQALARGVQLHATCLEYAVLADAKRLRQVLLNLVSNAIKYNHEHGQVWLQAAASGTLVRLSVRDSGRGIAPDRLPELFQPFNRLGAETEAIEGSGIGLAIAKSLAEHMGGHIEVRSELGVGTLFEVVLPAAPGTQVAIAAHTAAPCALAANYRTASDGRHAPGNRGEPLGPQITRTVAAPTHAPRRVLYIEDNEVNALILTELLATVPGYQLMVARDGASGMAMAQDTAPELVLLDMQLPDMDGFEVLRRLRESPITTHLPVVALSANVLPEQVSRGLAAGLVDYWAKPLDMPVFMQRLRSLLPPLAP